MKTDIDITYNALNSWYLDTSDFTINEYRLNQDLIIMGRNTKKFRDELVGGKRKVKNIVWDILLHLSNLRIAENEMPYHQDYHATAYQVEKWLNEYGDGYDTLAEAVDVLRQLRKED